MMNTISTRYNPKETENKWFDFWQEKGYFHANPSLDKKPYCIVIPPPNVTGILHMGHALNNTIQDILIRYKRMQGFCALWVPGTDHAGIATQNVVERELSKEKKSRHDLGREKFLEKVWEWTNKNGGTIIGQLKKLGCSCDWERRRFTLDDKYSKAVNEVFIKLYRDKLIYKGSYIINWCPRCQTALSDEEAAHKEIQGNLYYIKYPLKQSTENRKQKTEKKTSSEQGIAGDDYVVVATTRPETMFGDTALAVNPNDERYKNLIGKFAILPIAGREIEIIADEIIDLQFGTGIVKVTPLHDPNDFDIANRHKLKGVFCINADGTMNENATENYAGLDRFEAREALLEDLKERKLLEKIEQHLHAVGHCYRCHTVIEPYFSEQWFVKMKPLSIKALFAAETGEIKFYPERWLKIYTNWMENIKDWCISRQIWWGHRIPAWYCGDCRRAYLEKRKTRELRLPLEISEEEAGIIYVGEEKPQSCPKCKSKNIEQDTDVLDTWFSSWLWPFAVFNWPDQKSKIKNQKSKSKSEEKQISDLEYFYPTSALVTASEIIFFWVARMIMAGFYFRGEKPFSDVCIHGTVRDDKGRKMSKSLGNAIDPIEVIEKYGADALRFSLISLPGEDLYLSENKFEFGRNFVNKLWNASRFILMNLDEKKLEDVSIEELGKILSKKDSYLAESWIVGELNQLVMDVDEEFKSYRFNEAVNKLYDFFWHKFCDWYIEIAKINIADEITQTVLFVCLKTTLKLLHPFIPFATEEIWHLLPLEKEESIMISSWTGADKKLIDIAAKERFEECIAKPVKEARNYRKNHNIPPSDVIPRVNIYIHNPSLINVIDKYEDIIKKLAKIDKIEIFIFENSMPAVTGIRVRISAEGLMDVEREKERLNKQLEKLTAERDKKLQRLCNENFVQKAPQSVVEEEKNKVEAIGAEIKNLKKSLNELE